MRILLLTASVVLMFILLADFLRTQAAISFALRRKGYEGRISWHLLLSYVPLAMMFAPIGIAKLLGVNTRNVGSPQAFLGLIALTVLSCHIGSRATRWIVDSLPEAPRNKRTPPDRPYAILALLSTAALLSAPPAALILGHGWDTAGRLFLFFLALTIFLYSNSQRQSTRSRAKVAMSGSEPHVLYMRPFESDEQVFARKRRTGVWRLLPVPDRSTAETGIADGGYQTFETFIKGSLTTAIGPLKALGSPRDELPQAHGADRLYFKDNEWQSEFAELAAKSRCIVGTVTNISPHVCWELRHILTNGLADKLFLCTAPVSQDRFEQFYLKCWGVLFGAPAAEYWGVAEKSWTEIKQTLRKTGYDPPNDHPKEGAVLAFTRAGKAQIVLKGAVHPEQYVNAMVNELASRDQ